MAAKSFGIETIDVAQAPLLQREPKQIIDAFGVDRTLLVKKCIDKYGKDAASKNKFRIELRRDRYKIYVIESSAEPLSEADIIELKPYLKDFER